MQLVLPPEVEELVQQQLDSGNYSSPVDVVLAAMQLLKDQEDIYKGRLHELQADVELGLEDVAKGRVVDGLTALEQIRNNLRSRKVSSILT